MKPTREEIRTAANAGDLQLLRKLAAQGADFNNTEPEGNSLLEDIISDLLREEQPYKYSVVKMFLDLGANPNVLGSEGSSPLIPAMLRMDTEMLRLLLEAGANPNLVNGFTEDESLYDWAEFDYRYEIYDINPPDEPTENDKKNEDSWLQFLDKIAIKNNVRRPDHLCLLRSFGAKCRHEMGKSNLD